MNEKIFCEKCGTILEIKTTKEKNKFALCENCGFVKEINSDIISYEKEPEKEKIGEGVVKEVKIPGFPHKCKKCGYSECNIYDLGASYSDEASIYLYQCKKCNYVERQADGTGNK